MLQDMREKAQGWVAKVIVAAIAFTFAIFGLESLRPNTGNPDVATVNGEAITQQQLMETMDQQRRLLIQQMGNNFDPSMLDDRLLQQAALDSLVQRTLLREEFKATNMVVSEQMLDQIIRTTPEFQVDGRYEPERVMQYMRAMGLTVGQFRNFLREEMMTTQLRAGIAASEFITPYELQSLNNLQNQTRDISWLVLDIDEARKAVQVSDEDVSAYYEANSAQFMQPEQVSVNYIVLDKAKLAESIAVTESDVRARYDARVAELRSTAAEQVSASMILLEPNDVRNEAATLAEAERLHKKLVDGADFASLAEEFSEEPDSAAKGGNLGVVEPGFFGDAFDNTLASLGAGQVSEPVIVDFGVVLIRRDGAAEARIPSFDQMRASLMRELREQAVDPIFVEKSQRLADISFEASDLVQPAEELGLAIQQTGLFDRNGGEGVAANPRVIAAAFSDDVLGLRANSDLVELSPDQVMVLHIREHKKSELQDMSLVREDIVQSLRDERGAEELRQQADKLVSSLAAGDDAEKVAQENSLSWQEHLKAYRFNRDVPAQLLAEAFRLPHPPADNEFSYGSTALPNGDLAVIQVSHVTPGVELINPEQMRMMSATIALRNGAQLYDEYLRNLRERADVKVLNRDDSGS